MQNVHANLSIELNVTCPHCEGYFDLFEVDDGWLNDDGYLMENALPVGDWTDTHEKFKETVSCPECKEIVEIHGIAW